MSDDGIDLGHGHTLSGGGVEVCLSDDLHIGEVWQDLSDVADPAVEDIYEIPAEQYARWQAAMHTYQQTQDEIARLRADRWPNVKEHYERRGRFTDDCGQEMADLAKHAYQAYGESTGFENYAGLPMPEWDDLGERIQGAWVAATEAVRKKVIAAPARAVPESAPPASAPNPHLARCICPIVWHAIVSPPPCPVHGQAQMPIVSC